MAENRVTNSQKMLLKILSYSVPVMIGSGVLSFLLEEVLHTGHAIRGPLFGLFFVSGLAAALTFIAYLISLVISKN